MADQNNNKEVKEEPRNDQEVAIETSVSSAPAQNSSGKGTIFISLIALAISSYVFLSPPPPPPKIDLSKIDKLDKKIDKISSKTDKEYKAVRDEIDKLLTSVHSEQKGIKDNLDTVTSSVSQAHKIMAKMNLAIAKNEHDLEYAIADSAEKFEQQQNQLNLGSGFTNLITEIKPSLSIYCKRANVAYIKLAKTAKSGTNSVAVNCNFSNSGVLKANIVPGPVILIGGKGQKVIDNAVERIDNGEETTILPGRSHDKQYHIVLTSGGVSNMKGGVMKMSFQSSTDKAALNIIKRKTSKRITEKQLRELTKKSHIFSFLL
tara:strand:- start:6368 stop:7321 length:954 start_codon:yes stop_codon:yes gene_type:complete